MAPTQPCSKCGAPVSTEEARLVELHNGPSSRGMGPLAELGRRALCLDCAQDQRRRRVVANIIGLSILGTVIVAYLIAALVRHL